MEVALSKTKNVINETIEQSTNIFYSRPGNIGQQISYGVSLNGAIPITKWCTLQLYAEWIYNDYQATLYGQKLSNKGSYWYVGPSLQFQLNQRWAAEISGNYQTAIAMAQFITIPVGSMRVGVSKKILRDKGTVKLHLNDALYTHQPGGDIQCLSNSFAGWRSYLDTRVLKHSINYRFAKGQNLASRNIGGNESEKNRVH